MRDIELLQIEMDVLWPADTGPDLVVATSREGMRARCSRAVPESLAAAVRAELDAARPDARLDSPPPIVERLRLQLEDVLGDAVALLPQSGPSFLVHDEVKFRATASLVRSGGPDVKRLLLANPGNWSADEWHQLLEGRLGPWAMAVVDGRIASICHTSRCNASAAEAGVWTHPDFRGRGHAAACTAEWASLMRPSRRLLFYSTSRTNYSSQRVAARLGLLRLGALWQLSRIDRSTPEAHVATATSTSSSPVLPARHAAGSESGLPGDQQTCRRHDQDGPRPACRVE